MLTELQSTPFISTFFMSYKSRNRGCPKLLRVRGGIGHPEGDLEGRVTTAELDVAFVVNVYTPNAGAGLKRLDFRTKDWDQAFAAYVRDLEKIKPVVVVGKLCFCGRYSRIHRG